MIYYLVTRNHRFTMEIYLQSWGRALTPQIRIVCYEQLPCRRRWPAGTYIFSDLERLSPDQRRAAALWWEQLSAASGTRLLNNPSQVLRRYELLAALAESGRNRFHVWRARDAGRVDRFPVFLRHERDHKGSLSSLLRNQAELSAAMARVQAQGTLLDELLVVEFCDTVDADGVYRKYSAFIVGGRIVPRHLIFSRGWMLKMPDLIDERKLAEERAYLDVNPHESWLREIFTLARIDYGRIDYSLLDGRPQAWEINTNPTVMLRPHQYDPQHLPQQEGFARDIHAAFDAIDAEPTDRSVSIRVPVALRARLQWSVWVGQVGDTTRRIMRFAKRDADA